jgi:hypothetical protein
VVAAVILSACGSSTETVTHRYVQVGGERVEIPEGSGKGIFAVTRALYKNSAYEPWYANCIVGQMEKLVKPKEARALAKASEQKLSLREVELTYKAAPACEDSGRKPVNPKATSEQLAPIREQTAASFRTIFENDPKSSQKQTACVERVIKALSDEQVVRLANAGTKEEENLVGEFFLPCFPE